MRVVGLIPARLGSKGIPGKNWRSLAGLAPVVRAQECAHHAGLDECYVSAEADARGRIGYDFLIRPDELAQDDTPMYAVVQHAAQTLALAPDDLIVLLQPTQPLREPKHITAALQRYRDDPHATSVVSLVEVPDSGRLVEIIDGGVWIPTGLPDARRQDCPNLYRRDGTVYVIRVKTLAGGDIYGRHPVPLIIPASESCPLDTPEDWADAERRLQAREHAHV